jgi:lipid II:glycine glycyltransferase (peptidoglycan interpeptide bridge formation enzyme)
MTLKEINNKEDWEKFLAQISEKTFLQSWNWGEFNLQSGNKIWRFGIYENKTLLAVCFVTKIIAKRGKFLFVPHGPVINETLNTKDKRDIMQIFVQQISDLAREEGASFIRISPILEKNEENQNMFLELGFKDAPMHASAYEATWKLDLLANSEDLVHQMRKTTRYLVRKASTNPDISIEITSDPKNIEIYQKLNREVSKRQNFIPFSDDFIKREFELFKKDNEVVFIFGKYKGEIAAGAMIIFWSGVGYYHQAASLGKFSKLSIPYLLQWEAIKEAEKKGCKVYDFWGFTDPEKFPNHPWAGPTLFKMGFGGYKKEYIPTQDFLISQKYWLNYIIEKIRKKIRKL